MNQTTETNQRFVFHLTFVRYRLLSIARQHVPYRSHQQRAS
jgi:hypothetical protein